MLNRIFVFVVATFVGSASGLCLASQTKPNVVFIAIDDLRTELGCYDLPHVQSPNLDRLAAQGVLFDNHFVQVATCGASRFSMLTGRSPKQTGVTHKNHAFYQGPTALSHVETDAAQTMPELFRRNGYRTISIGKISHTADGRVFAYDGQGDGRLEMPHAWDELSTPLGSWKRGWGVFFAYQGGRHREDGSGHRDLMEFVAQRDEDLPDGLNAQLACEKLTELSGAKQPFFLAVGFYKPHLPFVATQGDWDAFADVELPAAPQSAKIESPYWHRSGEFYKYDSSFTKSHPLSRPDQLTARRGYLACVRYVDRQVGKVLRKLNELGLDESTIVVVWGDHGWHLGDSAIWAKHTPFERAVHSTLMIRGPGISAGVRCDAIVQSLDIYPTLVDLCQTKFRATQFPLDGKSLRPLLMGREAQIHKSVVSYWNKAISVRTPTHRLIAKVQPDQPPTDVELYDIKDGPDPVNNLAKSRPDLVAEILQAAPE